MENIFLFQGDRFLCCRARDNIVDSLSQKSEWSVKNISEPMSASEFTWTVNGKEIFGTKNKIFVLDGFIPEPSEEIIPLIKNLPKSKIIIFIFSDKQSIDKRTKIGKFLAKNIKEFPSMFNDKGYLDQSQIEKAKPEIRSSVGWNGSDDALDYIMEKSDYEYGSIINEIEKINVYLGHDPKSSDEIKDIVCTNDLLRLEPLFDKIKERDLIESLNLSQSLLEGDQFKSHYMAFFLGLLDNLNFMMYCNMATGSGISELNDLVEFVSENYIKSGKKIPVQTVRGRYFFVKDNLKKWTIEDLQFAISKIEDSIKLCMLDMRSDRFILENFLAQTV